MIINNGGNVEKLEPSYTSEGKLKQYSNFKASVTVRQEPKHRTPYDTAIPLMGRCPRVMKTTKNTKIFCTKPVYKYSQNSIHDGLKV